MKRYSFFAVDGKKKSFLGFGVNTKSFQLTATLFSCVNSNTNIQTHAQNTHTHTQTHTHRKIQTDIFSLLFALCKYFSSVLPSHHHDCGCCCFLVEFSLKNWSNQVECSDQGFRRFYFLKPLKSDNIADMAKLPPSKEFLRPLCLLLDASF